MDKGTREHSPERINRLFGELRHARVRCRCGMVRWNDDDGCRESRRNGGAAG